MPERGFITLLALAALAGAAPRGALAQAEAGPQKVTCTWGEPQPGEAIPNCGQLRRLSVDAPGGVAKLMFARDDNPTLSRYQYRARAVGAPAKTFRRMINVSNTDLVLCPSDFQKARILAFRIMKGKMIASRPTCEVAAPGAAPAPAMSPDAMAPSDAMAAPPAMEPGADAMAEPAMAAPPSAGGVSQAIERDNPVRQRDLVKLRRAIKMDSLARLLGLLGLLLGLAACVGVVVLALTLRRRVQRLERDLDRSRADDA